MAPATISEAEAEPLLIITASGILSSTASFVVLKSSSNCFTFPFVETISFPWATKRFTISTASVSKPPGFPLRSRMICWTLFSFSADHCIFNICNAVLCETGKSYISCF